jgi:seryl-tRNA(Sec) selenium transferase
LGRERNLPMFNDAASDVPPTSRRSDYVYVKEGFDLVALSGGKGLMVRNVRAC